MRIHERRFPRVRASTRVDWRPVESATHVVSNLANVSAGGAMVMTSVPAPVGVEVEIFLLTDLGPIGTRGKVAWSNGGGMGVRFDAA
jgi:hypothetical protein